jgi:DNA-binding MarR family transcriptional regulator
MVPDMELRQLRYFVAVAEDGNISRAAKRIFLTQPALSRQIKALESEIGQCLFERQAHSIRLTPVGEALLDEARELLDHAERMVERVRGAGRGVRLRVGYAPSLAAGILSVTVVNFTQTHPGGVNSPMAAVESGLGVADGHHPRGAAPAGRRPAQAIVPSAGAALHCGWPSRQPSRGPAAGGVYRGTA